MDVRNCGRSLFGANGHVDFWRLSGGPLPAASEAPRTLGNRLKRTEELKQLLLLRRTQVSKAVYHLSRLAFVALNCTLQT